MLLDRSKPNDQQGFGDYLSDLSYKNGFNDVGRFKRFLINSSKKKYYVCCSYSGLVRIISGLFIELGIDDVPSAVVQRPQCFRCLYMEPKNWDWDLPDKARCHQLVSVRGLFDSPRNQFQDNRASYCGLMMCSVKKLGLNFSPLKEGLYYADILSKEERDEESVPRIYASHRAFTRI